MHIEQVLRDKWVNRPRRIRIHRNGDFIKKPTTCLRCKRPYYILWLREVKDEQFGWATVAINPMCGDCKKELFARAEAARDNKNAA